MKRAEHIRRLLICLGWLAMTVVGRAQPVDNTWIFGNNAGLDFNAAIPAAFLAPAGGYDAYEGCASISDEDGVLLFFTNGQVVWDREFHVMPNGDGIVPADVLVSSATQAAAIVPVPGSTTRYYIFSLEEQGMPGRLHYSLVDMALNGGSGDVVAGEKGVLLDSGLSERMTIAPGKCMHTWIIVRSRYANEYKAYAIGEAGLDTAPVISVTGNAPLSSYISGALKCSNDGNTIAAALFPRDPEHIAAIELYDFDGNTGVLSDAVTLTEKEAGPEEGGYYSVCFSPDDSRLYTSNHFPNKVDQFDISLPTAEAMRASEIMVGDMAYAIPGDMRTGPDGKLYIAVFEKNYLNRIEFPNMAGSACGFVNNAVILPGGATCMLGLPNRNMPGGPGVSLDTLSSYTYIAACSTALLSCPAAEGPYLWNTGETSRDITVSGPGIYRVVSKNTCAVMIDSFEVAFAALPVSLLGSDTLVCAGTAVTLSVLPGLSAYFSLLWNTGSAERSITAALPGTYYVTASLPPCSATDTLHVTYKDCDCQLEMPSVFSPNGDGVNDLFIPVRSPGCAAINSYSLHVFNRWGQRIFSSNVPDRGWDGLHEGIPVEIGAYFYTLSYVDRYNKLQQRKGDVTVLR